MKKAYCYILSNILALSPDRISDLLLQSTGPFPNQEEEKNVLRRNNILFHQSQAVSSGRVWEIDRCLPIHYSGSSCFI